MVPRNLQLVVASITSVVIAVQAQGCAYVTTDGIPCLASFKVPDDAATYSPCQQDTAMPYYTTDMNSEQYKPWCATAVDTVTGLYDGVGGHCAEINCASHLYDEPTAKISINNESTRLFFTDTFYDGEDFDITVDIANVQSSNPINIEFIQALLLDSDGTALYRGTADIITPVTSGSVTVTLERVASLSGVAASSGLSLTAILIQDKSYAPPLPATLAVPTTTSSSTTEVVTSTPTTTITSTATVTMTTTMTTTATTTAVASLKDFELVFESGPQSSNSVRFSTGRNSSNILFTFQNNQDLETCLSECLSNVDCLGIYRFETAAGNVKCNLLNDLGDNIGKINNLVSHSYRRIITTTTSSSTSSDTTTTTSSESSSSTTSSETSTTSSSETSSSSTSSETSTTTSVTTTPTTTATSTVVPSLVEFELVFESGPGSSNSVRFSTAKNNTHILFKFQNNQDLQTCLSACLSDTNCLGVYYFDTAGGVTKCNLLDDLGDNIGRINNLVSYSYKKITTTTSSSTSTSTSDTIPTTTQTTTLTSTLTSTVTTTVTTSPSTTGTVSPTMTPTSTVTSTATTTMSTTRTSTATTTMTSSATSTVTVSPTSTPSSTATSTATTTMTSSATSTLTSSATSSPTITPTTTLRTTQTTTLTSSLTSSPSTTMTTSLTSSETTTQTSSLTTSLTSSASSTMTFTQSTTPSSTATTSQTTTVTSSQTTTITSTGTTSPTSTTLTSSQTTTSTSTATTSQTSSPTTSGTSTVTSTPTSTGTSTVTSTRTTSLTSTITTTLTTSDTTSQTTTETTTATSTMITTTMTSSPTTIGTTLTSTTTATSSSTTTGSTSSTSSTSSTTSTKIIGGTPVTNASRKKELLPTSAITILALLAFVFLLVLLALLLKYCTDKKDRTGHLEESFGGENGRVITSMRSPPTMGSSLSSPPKSKSKRISRKGSKVLPFVQATDQAVSPISPKKDNLWVGSGRSSVAQVSAPQVFHPASMTTTVAGAGSTKKSVLPPREFSSSDSDSSINGDFTEVQDALSRPLPKVPQPSPPRLPGNNNPLHQNSTTADLPTPPFVLFGIPDSPTMRTPSPNQVGGTQLMKPNIQAAHSSSKKLPEIRGMRAANSSVGQSMGSRDLLEESEL